MADPWSILRRGGLPLGQPDPAASSPTVDELATAARAAIATAPAGRERDALSAFVLAWCRRWPRSFARSFGGEAIAIRAWADAAVTDPNRYLKLTRIATAHLANVL